MTGSAIDCYYLPVAAAGDLAAQRYGNLKPVLAQEANVARFTALDCFDQSLHHSGRLLVQTDTTVELISNDSPVTSQPADGKERFITEFQKGPVKQALADFPPLRCLLPLGSGTRHQATLALVDDEDKTHCRAHLVQLTMQAGHSATLVTLQGVKGYDESLSLLRAHIRALGGVTLNCGDVYEQLFLAQPAYDAKPQIHIASDETAFDAANEIISTCIPVARANEAGIAADHDTEFLHDYRIQLRKIRSVLSLFKGVYDDTLTADLKIRFSTLMASTGRLRDLDVYLLEKQKFHALLPNTLHEGLSALFGMFAEERKAEQENVAHLLKGRSYKKEITDLTKFFANPKRLQRGPNADLLAHDYACALIWKRYRKVCKIATAVTPNTQDPEIHELRIHCKKLRYLMDFFGPVFPKAALRSLLKPLKGLQENLGMFNDYSVQQASLQAFLLKLCDDQAHARIEIAQSVGALIVVLHTHQLEERAKVMKSFARFNSPKTQQTFSELFQQRKDGK